MSRIYKVRYRKGDLEIEVESDDKRYIEVMLNKLRSENPLTTPYDNVKSRNSPPRANMRPTLSKRVVSKPPYVDAIAVCKAISESKDHHLIEENVLKRANQLGRVLLAFWSAHEYGYTHLRVRA